MGQRKNHYVLPAYLFNSLIIVILRINIFDDGDLLDAFFSMRDRNWVNLNERRCGKELKGIKVMGNHIRIYYKKKVRWL